jgi:hypothetical protein
VGQAKGLWRWWLRKISPLAILNDDGFEISNGNIIIIIIIILLPPKWKLSFFF